MSATLASPDPPSYVLTPITLIALHLTLLFTTTIQCTGLQENALHCRVLKLTALHSTALHFTALHLRFGRAQPKNLSFSKHRPLGRCFLLVNLSICLCVCLCVCLFTFEVRFKHLFAPTSRSRMSKIFRDSESLGKSNGKKWSQI